MKKFFAVMCMVSALAVSGCSATTNDKSWEPIASARTAGSVGHQATVAPVERRPADKSFDRSLRK
ncbi:MAG: hypothetical protein EA357_07020 [Micavibrio sp.]|jgi:hypothetical protein|nr:MAG: hypothetical protein EA357_07020 [Micavibrio sp.]